MEQISICRRAEEEEPRRCPLPARRPRSPCAAPAGVGRAPRCDESHSPAGPTVGILATCSPESQQLDGGGAAPLVPGGTTTPERTGFTQKRGRGTGTCPRPPAPWRSRSRLTGTSPDTQRIRVLDLYAGRRSRLPCTAASSRETVGRQLMRSAGHHSGEQLGHGGEVRPGASSVPMHLELHDQTVDPRHH